MNRVSDIIARKGVSAIAVPPDTPVIDALQIMADKNIGSVLIMDAGEYLGIMTERDIRYLPVFENLQLVGIISITDVVKQTILLQQETINHLDDYIHSR